MEVIKERIRPGGRLQIPEAIMNHLKLSVGGEVKLSVVGNKLIVEPLKVERKRLKICPEIIDELVENEELFQPEEM